MASCLHLPVIQLLFFLFQKKIYIYMYIYIYIFIVLDCKDTESPSSIYSFGSVTKMLKHCHCTVKGW